MQKLFFFTLFFFSTFSSLFVTSSFAIDPITLGLGVGTGGDNKSPQYYGRWIDAEVEIRNLTNEWPQRKLNYYIYWSGSIFQSKKTQVEQCSTNLSCRYQVYEYLVDKDYLSCMEPTPVVGWLFKSYAKTPEEINERAKKCIPRALKYADEHIKDYDVYLADYNDTRKSTPVENNSTNEVDFQKKFLIKSDKE